MTGAHPIETRALPDSIPRASATPPAFPAEGELLFEPSHERRGSAQITAYTAWLERTSGVSCADYEALWRWSVERSDAFWTSIWRFCDVQADGEPLPVREGEDMQSTRWFPRARVNYAEHLLRREADAPDEGAIVHASETRPLREMTWRELGELVRTLATRLRERGVGPGDRVVSYMPNLAETVVAMLATVAVGGVWSAAAPEFGAATVLQRFGQIAPKAAFMADGYSFGGKALDRRDEVRAIVEGSGTLELVVWLPYLGQPAPELPGVEVVAFEDLVRGPAPRRAGFAYHRAATDEPLWVLFSSGTTGLPKAIVHNHAGVLLEHLKAARLHCDLAPGSRAFFYTTTGWMMWNALVSALVAGATIVLYDGSPVASGIDHLWRLAAATRTTHFGASPTLVRLMKGAGLTPGVDHDLSTLRAIILGGAPSTPDVFAWFYRAVSPDLWISSQSGGTEVCTALVTGCPTLPVRAGEIQCRALGMDVHAWGEDGCEVVDEVGELVVTGPMPSAPIRFWGDPGGDRYRSTYFEHFPGVWRHGDLIKITRAGGAYVYGRSDATLNRFGVRIGSAEIYAVLDTAPDVADGLVVCCETPDGGWYMPLFVQVKPGRTLDESMRRDLTERLRRDASPRHVPDEYVQVDAIPYTLTGKKMEVPVRRLLMGRSVAEVASQGSMSDPSVLDWYAAYAARPEVAARRTAAAAREG